MVLPFSGEVRVRVVRNPSVVSCMGSLGLDARGVSGCALVMPCGPTGCWQLLCNSVRHCVLWHVLRSFTVHGPCPPPGGVLRARGGVSCVVDPTVTRNSLTWSGVESFDVGLTSHLRWLPHECATCGWRSFPMVRALPTSLGCCLVLGGLGHVWLGCPCLPLRAVVWRPSR